MTQITRFLELLDIEVISGASYEPRRVTEKVRSRLSSNIDFVVYLVTKDGETAWTRDELITGLGVDAHLVPIVESGAKMEIGILGDLEYIPFESGHISDAFVRLLEAVRFIQNT